MPKLNGFAKKRNYDAKISEIQRKYVATPDYNKFVSYILDAKIKQKELINKFNISNLVINSGVNPKLATLAPKGESNAK